MKYITFLIMTPDTVPGAAKRDILRVSTSDIRQYHFSILDYKTYDW